VVWTAQGWTWTFQRTEAGGALASVKTPEYIRLSDSLVPVVEDDVLWRVNAIVRYLCASGNPALAPLDLRQRFDMSAGWTGSKPPSTRPAALSL
jgi:glutathione S-transferase